MSKRAFNGQNDAPAPAQGPEQISVHDQPTQKAVPAPKPKPAQYSDKPNYNQKSEAGNDGHSGLPIKSDGSYRDSSDLKQSDKK
jgi:hypothetical protein